MYKNALIISVFTLLSKFLGFLREILIAARLGTSGFADLIILIISLPTLLFSTFASGFLNSYISINIKSDNNSSVSKTISSSIIVILCFSSIISLLLFLFSEEIIRIFSNGMKREYIELGTSLFRISIIGMLFIAVNSILQAHLQLKQKFLIVSISNLIINLSVVCVLFINTTEVVFVNWITWGLVLGYIFQFLFLDFYLRKKLHVKISVKGLNILEFKKSLRMLFMSFSIMISVGIQQINMLVDRYLSSQQGIGGISLLNYSAKLNAFVFGIVSFSISSVVLPYLVSKKNGESDRLLFKSLNLFSVCTVPLIVYCYIDPIVLVKIVYGNGKLNESDLATIISLIRFFSVGMLFFGFREIVTKAFYAKKDTSTPLKSSIYLVVLNIVFSSLLSLKLGLNGIALGTSLAAIITTIFLISFYVKINKVSIEMIKKMILLNIIYIVYCSILFLIIKMSIKEDMMGSLIYFSCSYLISLIYFYKEKKEVK